jgi:hypothetical protein
VIHQRHPTLGILLPLRPDQVLTHDPRALNGTRQLGHQRLPP